jgi:hypothetical protein
MIRVAVVAVEFTRVVRIGRIVPTGIAENRTVRPSFIMQVILPIPPTYKASVTAMFTVSLGVTATALP